MLDGTLVKVVAWYDNEWGYSNRCVELAQKVAGACARSTTLDVEGKRVLVRVDFNVPLDGDGEITDDARIRAALPTLDRAARAGARLMLAAHLGRPKDREPKLSLRPVAERLGELLGEPRSPLAPSLDEVPRRRASSMLENVRFEPGETKNDPELAARSPRSPTSTSTTPSAPRTARTPRPRASRTCSRARAGRLLEREVTTLAGILEDPERPLVAVVGGAKVTDKIGVLDAFLQRADAS